MKKLFLTMGLAAITAMGFGQTVSKSPIFDNNYQSLTIKELYDDGKYCTIWVGHQNPEYTAIVDIVSFLVDDKESLIFLMEECIRVLEMDKTGEDNHIRHSVNGVSMVRYGFSQDTIKLGSGLRISKSLAKKIIDSLNSYNSYSCEGNKN